MVTARRTVVFRHLSRDPLVTRTDGELLRAFLSGSDAAAFAALMGRHGRMVLRVCTNRLGHTQDAEDVLQATFLLLAQQAAAVRKTESLASWLHGVAYRMATRTKRAAARRHRHEARAAPPPPQDPALSAAGRELQALLDAEMDGLPEALRGPFVLCCLEGASYAEAARSLGLKEGTVRNRLGRARKLLRERLTRRGVSLTAALTAVAAGSTAPAAAALRSLTGPTVRAAAQVAAGQGLIAGHVPARVISLLNGVNRTMFLVKCKLVLYAALATALAAAGLEQMGPNGTSAPVPSERPVPIASSANRSTFVRAEPAGDGAQVLNGRVNGPNGRPQDGAQLVLLGPGGRAEDLGRSGADGQFRVTVPAGTGRRYIAAGAEGAGIDFVEVKAVKPKAPIEFRLVKDHAVRGRLVDTEGKPVAKAKVEVVFVGLYADDSLDSFLAAWKERHFQSGRPDAARQLEDEAAALFATTTDAAGRFEIHGAGGDRLLALRIRSPGAAEGEAWVVNRQGFDPKPYNEATAAKIPEGTDRRWGFNPVLLGPEPTLVAEREKVVSGTVKEPKSGKGRAGVRVRLVHDDDRRPQALTTSTDATGRFEFRGARKAKGYSVEIDSDPGAALLPRQTAVDDSPGFEPVVADVELAKGTVVSGRMYDKATGKPVPGVGWAVALSGNRFYDARPEYKSGAMTPFPVAADGTFRVVTIPGPVLLIGECRLPNDAVTPLKYRLATGDPKTYPEYFRAREDHTEYSSVFGGLPLPGHSCQVLEIDEGAEVLKRDIVLEPGRAVPVRIRNGAGRPVAGAWVTGMGGANWNPPLRCETDTCSAYQLEPGRPRRMVFFDPKQKLAGTLTVTGDEKEALVAELAPVGSLTGRLVGADGKPLAGVAVGFRFRDRAATEMHAFHHRAQTVVTAADGTFAVEALVPGPEFELTFQKGADRFVAARKPEERTIRVKAGEARTLGAVTLSPATDERGE